MDRMRTPVPIVALGLALLGLLPGCASAPVVDRKVESSRLVEAPAAEIAPRITRFLQRRNIGVVRATPGLIQGLQRPLANADWARCPTVHVRDPEGERRRRAELLDLHLELDVALERLSGRTLVSVEPAFIGTYHNSFTNLTFERRCGSSQQLERALLGAI